MTDDAVCELSMKPYFKDINVIIEDTIVFLPESIRTTRLLKLTVKDIN